MSINISGSYVEFAKLVKCAIDNKQGRLVESIIKGMKKSKYDDSGLTWYVGLDNDAINEMDNIVANWKCDGFSELMLNYLRAVSKAKEVNKNE